MQKVSRMGEGFGLVCDQDRRGRGQTMRTAKSLTLPALISTSRPKIATTRWIHFQMKNVQNKNRSAITNEQWGYPQAKKIEQGRLSVSMSRTNKRPRLVQAARLGLNIPQETHRSWEEECAKLESYCLLAPCKRVQQWGIDNGRHFCRRWQIFWAKRNGNSSLAKLRWNQN